jgi:hypothetical protein
MIRAALSHTRGEFSYPVDDAYIHLALARHIAFDGVYGVTRYAFSASSSSVAWPWLLACAMRLFGNHVVLPLVLNAAGVVALLAVIGRGLERDAPALSLTARTLVLLAVVMLMPLASLALIGMEHVAQAALTVAFVLEAARVVSGDETRTWPLLALASALLAVRYEGVFPVGIAAVLLALRKRFGLAVALAVAGAAPVVLFGFYSMAHGSLFLPNSIALKRQHLQLKELSDLGDLLGGNVLSTMSAQSYLLPLAFGTMAFFAWDVWSGGMWTKDAIRLLIALGTTAAHVELASLGWFYRYEAYLVALDVTVIAIAIAPRGSTFSLRQAWRRSRFGFLLGVAAAAVGSAPLWMRALAAQGATPTACRNIYEQQVQTARLLATYFPHDDVAVNDIGAVAYYGDSPIVDLEGLASLPVARAKSLQLETPLDAKQLVSFTKDVPVAVIYDEWFPSVPTSWVRVGRLRIQANKVCASDMVSVYATSGENVPRVLAALRAFDASLPTDVRREGVWIETPPEAPASWRADSGDILRVEISGAPDLPGLFVDAAGSIWVPKVGEVNVRGKTREGVEAAVRAKATSSESAAKWPADVEVRADLFEERACHVMVTGNVFRPLNEPMVCGTTAARAIQRARGERSKPVDAYIWRQESGVPRRIDVSYDPQSGAGAGAIALQGDDIVIVK